MDAPEESSFSVSKSIKEQIEMAQNTIKCPENLSFWAVSELDQFKKVSIMSSLASLSSYQMVSLVEISSLMQTKSLSDLFFVTLPESTTLDFTKKITTGLWLSLPRKLGSDSLCSERGFLILSFRGSYYLDKESNKSLLSDVLLFSPTKSDIFTLTDFGVKDMAWDSLKAIFQNS